MIARSHSHPSQISAALFSHHRASSTAVTMGGTAARMQADLKKQGKEKKPDDIW